MRILLATHFFPPTQAGGTESYTLGLARALRARGHDVAVICAGSLDAAHAWPPRAQDDTFDEIPVRRLSWSWRHAPDPFVTFYDNPAAVKLIREHIAEFQPDVFHVTSCYSLGAGIIPAARAAGCRTLLTLTDFWFLCVRHTLLRGDDSLCSGPASARDCQRCMASASPGLSKLMRVMPGGLVADGLLAAARWPNAVRLPGMAGYVGDAQARQAFVRKAFEAADTVIAPSHFLKSMFVQNGYPAEEIFVSPHGLDLSWGPQPAPRPPDGKLTIGYLGQLEPLKGVDILVRAVRLLPPQAPVRLRIHGALEKNPPYVQSLRDLALDDPRIEFAGVYARPQLGAVLADLDVVAVPSVWYENAPLVIGEAFAAGRPALATNLGGMSEAVRHDVNGLLFERGDVTGLARVIQRFLDEPGLLARLRDGIGPVRTIDDEIEQLLQIYRGAPAGARAWRLPCDGLGSTFATSPTASSGASTRTCGTWCRR